MGAQILGITGNILTVKVTGRLERAELEEVQRSAAEAIRKHGPVRFLVLNEDFTGWGKDGDWGDLDFQADNDRYIEKMAIVSSEHWEDLILIFAAKEIRKFPIEHFRPAGVPLGKARRRRRIAGRGQKA